MIQLQYIASRYLTIHELSSTGILQVQIDLATENCSPTMIPFTPVAEGVTSEIFHGKIDDFRDFRPFLFIRLVGGFGCAQGVRLWQFDAINGGPRLIKERVCIKKLLKTTNVSLFQGEQSRKREPTD